MNHWRAWTSVELGEAVRRARKLKGWQQADLAELLGVTRMTVSRLERGESVGMDTALRALSECGYGLVVTPKFAHVEVTDRG
ncbi:helix-turn-helix transcriptional regulator [Nocardioides stalactiti]|uniref:helix-turn-helix transcriptional regulator n=1 Tax=Nocardioides stalactiti TaxID=2755356 RepID=UPI00160121BF|nr:helix-turn-helix transcriptional regulator [Nocardioides stalactiti]